MKTKTEDIRYEPVAGGYPDPRRPDLHLPPNRPLAAPSDGGIGPEFGRSAEITIETHRRRRPCGGFVVIMCELALLTPPVGMNLYVVQGVRNRGQLTDVVRGVMPHPRHPFTVHTVRSWITGARRRSVVPSRFSTWR